MPYPGMNVGVSRIETLDVSSDAYEPDDNNFGFFLDVGPPDTEGETSTIRGELHGGGSYTVSVTAAGRLEFAGQLILWRKVLTTTSMATGATLTAGYPDAGGQ